MQDHFNLRINASKQRSWHPRKVFRLSSMLLLLNLSGCMSQQVKPNLSLNVQQLQQIEQSYAQGLAHNQSLNTEAIPQDWWCVFNDPVLSQLQQQLLSNNLDLHVAMLRVEEAEAQLGLSQARTQPHIRLEGGYTRSTLSENAPLAQLGAYTHASNLWSLGVKSSWELDLWGHLKHLTQASQAQLEAKYYGQQDIQLSLSADLARHYLLLRAMQQQAEIHAQQAQIDAQLVQIAQHKLQHGVATQEAVAIAKQQQLETAAQQTQDAKQVALLKNNLALLVAAPPTTLNAVLAQPVAPLLAQSIPIGLSAEFVRQRADILQADAQLRAAVSNLDAAQADFYPRIGIRADLGAQAFQFHDLGDWASSTYGFGPIIHIPIFEGGRLKRTLEVNQSRQRMAALQYQHTVLNAWHEVDNALLDYQYQSQYHQEVLQQIQQKNKIVQVRQSNFKQGTLDQAEVLQAQKQLLALTLQQSNSQLAQTLSVIAIYRALGGGGAAQWTAIQRQARGQS